MRKFLFAVLFFGLTAPAIADDQCPMGYGYKMIADDGCVDMGTLDWSDRFDLGEGVFVVSMPDKAPGLMNVFAEGYTTTFEARSMPDMFITGHGSTKNVYIRNSQSASAAELKKALSGVYMCYQREVDLGWTPPTQEYEIPMIGACVLCPPNTYKDSVGNTDCTPCPARTMSPSGSISVNECGRILHVGNYISFMPVGRRTEHGLCTMLDGVKYCADVYERQ